MENSRINGIGHFRFGFTWFQFFFSKNGNLKTTKLRDTRYWEIVWGKKAHYPSYPTLTLHCFVCLVSRGFQIASKHHILEATNNAWLYGENQPEFTIVENYANYSTLILYMCIWGYANYSNSSELSKFNDVYSISNIYRLLYAGAGSKL